jgi:hypothetical protein
MVRRQLALWLVAVLTAAACGGSNGNDDTDVAATADAAAGDVETVATCTDGEPCDDGESCTYNGVCSEGECISEGPVLCEHYECMTGGCDGNGGCELGDLVDGWCFIQDSELCLWAGDPHPANPCLLCKPEEDASGYTFAPTGTPCQDANPCTDQDFCDHGTCMNGTPPSCADGLLCSVDECTVDGCVHDYDHVACDDANPCTVDMCSPESETNDGCVHIPDDSLPCGDGNVCTPNDRCENGQCVTDEPLACGDENPCTDEYCHAAYGCLYTFLDNDQACDDGALCTMDDHCYFGLCKGNDPWGNCPTCQLSFSEHVHKVANLRMGHSGTPGEAVNVDADLKTCSPEGDCEQGLDNLLMFASEYLDPTIDENLKGNTDASPLIFVAELVSPSLDGDEFTINVLYAGLSDKNPDCDFNSQTCVYQAASLNFDQLCTPQVSFSNATVEDGKLTAGGSGFYFPFHMQFVGGETADIVLYNATLEAQVSVTEEGIIDKLEGVLGGAVTPDNLEQLVLAIPDEYMPVDKSLLLNLLGMLTPDIDWDHDGEVDGLSAALVFETIPGILEPYNK